MSETFHYRRNKSSISILNVLSPRCWKIKPDTLLNHVKENCWGLRAYNWKYSGIDVLDGMCSN